MTNTFNEMPAHQVYYLLKQGETEASGPYSYHEVHYLITKKLVGSSDYIYFREWEDWKPIYEVFDVTQSLIQDFCEDGQDCEVASQALSFINSKAHPGEELHYISTQLLPARKITTTVRLTMPQSVILTNKRICVYRPKLGGKFKFDEFHFSYVDYAIKRIKPKSDCGSFNVVMKTRNWTEVQRLPFEQLNKLESLCSELIPH